MITPLEIQEKEFGRSLKGYKEDEVNDFLNQIIVDLEQLIAENSRLKAEGQKTMAELNKYKGDEGSVLETLATAKALMGDISASAEKRAEILLKNAELDAQLMQREARESVDRLMEENAVLQTRVSDFRRKYKQLLESELQRFDTLTNDLFSELGMKAPEEAWKQPPEPVVPQPAPQAAPNDAPSTPAAPLSNSGMTPADDRKKTMVHLK